MMNNSRTIFSALCFCLFAAVAMPIAAQSAGYTKLNVKGRVQLEVPSDWTISDAEQRTSQSVSAQSTVQPSGMPLNVSTSSISCCALRGSVLAKAITGA